MISEGEMVYEIRHGFQGYTWKIGIVNRVVYKPTQIGWYTVLCTGYIHKSRSTTPPFPSSPQPSLCEWETTTAHRCSYGSGNAQEGRWLVKLFE